jgi:hypothetical protein
MNRRESLKRMGLLGIGAAVAPALVGDVLAQERVRTVRWTECGDTISFDSADPIWTAPYHSTDIADAWLVVSSGHEYTRHTEVI